MNKLKVAKIESEMVTFDNGYYSDKLELVIADETGKTIREYNITECQDYNYE